MSQHGRQMNPSTVTRMEKGGRPTTAADIEALATIFRTTPTAIVGGTATTYDEAGSRRLRVASRNMDAAAEELGAAHQAFCEADARVGRSLKAYNAAQAELREALDAAHASDVDRLMSSTYVDLTAMEALRVLRGEEP